MSNEEIIKEMTDFVVDYERQIKAKKTASGEEPKTKDVIKYIRKKLDTLIDQYPESEDNK